MAHLPRGSQGVAIVGIYPCGKAREPDKSECRECTLSLSPNDLGLVLAVKGSALPRFAPWTVLRAYPKGWWFTREWGGGGQCLEPFGFSRLVYSQ